MIRMGSSTRPSVQALLATALATLLAGCTGEGELVVRMAPGLERVVSSLEVLVLVPWERDEERDQCSALLAYELPLDASLERAEWEVGQLGLELDAVASTGFDVVEDEPPSLGRIPDSSFVVVRGRDGACAIQGEGCARAEYGGGLGPHRVVVELDDSQGHQRCPAGFACSSARGGRCVDPSDVEEFCTAHHECNDGDLLTTDVCVDGRCVVSPDQDRDGTGPGDGNGDGLPDDCDDRREVVPSETTCGAALDHDCDGVVDDLDGCGADCAREPLGLATAGIDVEAHDVFASGERVVVAAGGDSPGLWVGDVDGETAAVSLRAFVELELSCRLQHPCALEVYGNIALVTHEEGLEVVDLQGLAPGSAASSTDLPLVLAPIDLAAMGGAIPVALTVAPPILLVGTSTGVTAFDMAQVAPAFGWPSYLGQPVTVPSVVSVAARNGTAFVTADQPGYFSCIHLGDLPGAQADEACFSLADVPPYDGGGSLTGLVEAVTTSASGDVFIVTAVVTGSPSSRHAYHLRDGDGDGDLEELVEYVVVEGITGFPETTATRRLLHTSGLLVRASRQGLALHDAEDLATASTYLGGIDVTGVAVASGTLLAAAGGSLYTAPLTCD